jgi:energy-coupling factor transporter ATP-binding protein EcfA2
MKTPRRNPPLLAPDGAGLQSTYYTGLLFGPNGCGKTTLAEQIAHTYVRLDGRAWAIDPNGAWEKSPGVKSLWPAEGIAGIDELLQDSATWKPGLVILDDADRYFRHPSQIRDDYLTSNRHMRKDLLVISRRPQGIPKDAISNARFVALFPGSLTEVHAHKYFSGVFPEEILAAVPTKEFHYLLIIREGARWRFSRLRTAPRKLSTKSDKS